MELILKYMKGRLNVGFLMRISLGRENSEALGTRCPEVRCGLFSDFTFDFDSESSLLTILINCLNKKWVINIQIIHMSQDLSIVINRRSKK
jgi:hypothetical protein